MSESSPRYNYLIGARCQNKTALIKKEKARLKAIHELEERHKVKWEEDKEKIKVGEMVIHKTRILMAVDLAIILQHPFFFYVYSLFKDIVEILRLYYIEDYYKGE